MLFCDAQESVLPQQQLGIRPECLMALCLSGLRSCVVGRIRRHTSHPAHCRLIAYSVRAGYAIRQNGFRRDNKQKHCRSSAFMSFHQVSQGKCCLMKINCGSEPDALHCSVFPVRFVHTGDNDAATGRRMDKLVIADINTNMTTGRTGAEQNQIACTQVIA